MKFCGSCGREILNICPSCEYPNPTDFNFCGKCGHNLNEGAIIESTSNAKPSPVSNDMVAASERRQLTVMFCDLADSTLLSDTLDPEELHAIIQKYQSTCADVINHYSGYIAQYLGDGILVYFCYPRAHEDDPRRAVYSALGCIDAIKKLNKELATKNISLALRIGIHTGLVVTGEIGTGEQREQLALGKTPNIAARLQNIAKLNSVCISDTTHNLTHGFFETQSLGQHTLKGINQPVEIYQVIKENNARDRIDVALRQGALLPIVGRENEIEQLSLLWNKVTDGGGQVVLLKGEGGVGKSRLMQAFIDQLDNSSHHYLCANGKAFSETSVLRPIIEMLHSTFEFAASDSSEERYKKMETLLTKYNFSLKDYIPLFASLLNIPLINNYVEPALPADFKKKRTLEMVFELLQKLSQERPLLFVVEDLHWLDPSTLEFLDMLILQEQAHKIFVFLTCRPSFDIPWYTRSNLVQFNLTHLNRSEIISMVNRLTNNRSLPQVLIDEIVTKTDGVPLFVEELTKMVINSSMVKEVNGGFQLIGNLASLSIPSTLQDLLNARLDSLGQAKEVAQLASIIGREFSFEMLLSISNFKPELLQTHINQLIEAELLSQRGFGTEILYIFRHALIHEAAISSMLKSRRQVVHKKFAQILETDYPDIVRERPEYLAYHFTEAGQIEQAIDWWLIAEQKALEQSANVEAISHYKQGMVLLKSLPESKENWLRELRLCASVGAAYCATTGYASHEVKTVYHRASELSKKMGDIPEQYQILWGLYAFYVVRAELDEARDSAQAMLSAAENKDNTLMQLEAMVALGLTEYFSGDVNNAYNYMLRAEQLDAPDRDRAFTYICGQDSSVGNLVYMGLALWLMGKPDQALSKSNDAIALARKIEHPFSIAYALNFSAWLHYMLRQVDSAATLADEVISLSSEHGFFWVTLGSVIAGWAQASKGDTVAGLNSISSGLQNYRGAGANLSQTLQLSIEADTCLQANELERAQTCLQEAILVAEQTGEKFWLADIHRLLGETYQQMDNAQAAESHFLNAVNIATEQNVPMLLLRAASSYTRIDGKSNKQSALRILQQAREKISTDMSLPDLQEADVLLNELQQPLQA